MKLLIALYNISAETKKSCVLSDANLIFLCHCFNSMLSYRKLHFCAGAVLWEYADGALISGNHRLPAASVKGPVESMFGHSYKRASPKTTSSEIYPIRFIGIAENDGTGGIKGRGGKGVTCYARA